MKKLILFIMSALVILGGCVQLPDNAQPDDPILPDMSLTLRELIASQRNLDLNEIKILSIEETVWQNSCLGIEKPEQTCLQALTPGYIIKIEIQGKEYTYHSDEAFEYIVLFEKAVETDNDISHNLHPAVAAAQGFLAEWLGINLDAIKLVSFEYRDWPNGCLGISAPDVMCIEVITPGYRVIFEVEGKTYILRTNTSGSLVKLETQGLEIKK